MNVLQVYTSDYPHVGGGVDAVVHSLLRGSRDDCVHSLLRVRPWHERELEQQRVQGVTVHNLYLPTPPGRRAGLRTWLAFLLLAPRAAARLRCLLREMHTDLVHLHTLQHYHLYFLLATLLGGPPYVVTLHGSEVHAYASRDWLSRAVWRWVLRRAAAVSAVSDTLTHDARTLLPAASRVVSIRNGVELNPDGVPHDLETRARLDLPARYCVMVGHLSAVKGHDVGLRAWRHLPASCADVALVVIGDGEQASVYRAQVERDGVASRVRFLGQLEHAETLAVIHASQVLLMPSRREGFGLVAIEAGAGGVAVIASDLPVFRELFGPEMCGVLVPPDDAQALARAAASLLKDESLRVRLGAALRARVEREFRAECCLEQYRGWYRAVIMNTVAMGRRRPA